MRTRAVRNGSAVPVRQQEQPLFGGGVKACYEVSERKRVSVCGDVIPTLYDEGVRPLSKETVEPISHGMMWLGSRNPRPKGHLSLDITERSGAVEFLGWSRLLTAGQGGEGQNDRKDGKVLAHGYNLVADP